MPATLRRPPRRVTGREARTGARRLLPEYNPPMALTPTFVSAGGLRLRVARQGSGRRCCSSPASARTSTCGRRSPATSAERELDRVRPARRGPLAAARGCRCGWAASPRVVRELLDALGARAASTCSATRSAARSPRSSRAARRSASGGSCCARRRPASAGSRRGRWRRSCSPRRRATTTRGCSRSASRTSRAAARRASPACSPRARRRALAQPPDPLGYAYQLYAVAGWSSLPWLHRVQQPTLVVAGEDDPSVPLRNAPHARGAPPRRAPARRQGRRPPVPPRRAGAAPIPPILALPRRASVTRSQRGRAISASALDDLALAICERVGASTHPER